MENSLNDSQENDLIGWTDLSVAVADISVQRMTDLIDDGLTNGFEFMLQGSHIYYRERTE